MLAHWIPNLNENENAHEIFNRIIFIHLKTKIALFKNLFKFGWPTKIFMYTLCEEEISLIWLLLIDRHHLLPFFRVFNEKENLLNTLCTDAEKAPSIKLNCCFAFETYSPLLLIFIVIIIFYPDLSHNVNFQAIWCVRRNCAPVKQMKFLRYERRRWLAKNPFQTLKSAEI